MTILREQLASVSGCGVHLPSGSRGAKPSTVRTGILHLTPGDVTVHGFRSSLHEYLGDETDVSYETAERNDLASRG
ncbi:hypothetical protein [Mesorhizobium sp. M0098]|uniref:hypothetical protein n=1 Tax=Mesorhizobium sp. M0098 TaxID=2956878 RepID=UPI003338165F